MASAQDDWRHQRQGTAILFKAVGEKRGVSKNAAITIVRTPEPILSAFNWGEYEQTGYYPYDHFEDAAVDGLDKIYDDVVLRGIAKGAVVNFLSGLDVDFSDMATFNEESRLLFSALKDLIDQGVVMVDAAGNDGHTYGQPISGTPTCFNRLLPIIVVGAHDEQGNIPSWVQYKPPVQIPDCKVDIWALGVNLKDDINNSEFGMSHGKSCVSPGFPSLC